MSRKKAKLRHSANNNNDSREDTRTELEASTVPIIDEVDKIQSTQGEMSFNDDSIVATKLDNKLSLFDSCLNVLNDENERLQFNDGKDVADKDLIGAGFIRVIEEQYQGYSENGQQECMQHHRNRIEKKDTMAKI